MNPQDKSILITGAAGGIGLALAEACAQRGGRIAVVDINAQGIARVAEEHPDWIALACDITVPEAVAEAVGTIEKAHGGIDVLVNNAALVHNEPLLSLSPNGFVTHGVESWNAVIAASLSSVMYVTSRVATGMAKTRRGGVVINVSSVASAGNKGQSAYSAAKAGVRALTRTWAKELAPLRIRVNAIAPGFTLTEKTKETMTESELKDVKGLTPLKKLGRVEDIVHGILFLMENDYMHGKILELDGGLQL